MISLREETLLFKHSSKIVEVIDMSWKNFSVIGHIIKIIVVKIENHNRHVYAG